MVALIEYSCSDNLKFLVTGGRKCLEKSEWNVWEMFKFSKVYAYRYGT